MKCLQFHPLTCGGSAADSTLAPPKDQLASKAPQPGILNANSSVGSTPLTITRTFLYTNFRGLHARPAALLVKSLSDFKCTVTAQCNGEKANAKSLLGLLCLAVGSQSKVTFTATGSDAPNAMSVLERLFQRQFDEAY